MGSVCPVLLKTWKVNTWCDGERRRRLEAHSKTPGDAAQHSPAELETECAGERVGGRTGWLLKRMPRLSLGERRGQGAAEHVEK